MPKEEIQRLDWIGLDWIGLDWIGLEWIGLDWIGLDWIARRYERPEERRSVISWKSKFLTMSFCQEFV